ncbi:MAG: glycosyltransferase family 39 protein [Thermoleophilaceae bacterium]|nr:glycosyltransferase family 39 protein [Thermoleophilaceae bacterium]
MATVASRARALPRADSLRTGAAGIVLVVGGLLLLSLWLRTRGLGASLWMDEGLSIGIASQPFFDIPGVLRQDGSPPLYYLMLNVWMNVVGRGPADTQGLSVAISLLAVPGGLWAGWTLFGRRAGLICAALGATNPFLTLYAQETRMYSLMVVLSLLTSAAFLHVYVYRHRKYLPVFAALLAAMLYTHSWGIFVTAGTLVAVVPAFMATDDRRALIRDVLIGFGAALLLYVPWLPTLLYQAAHTGAPWLDPPRFGVVVQISKGLLSGGTVTVALLLAAGSGCAAVLANRSESKERTAVYTAFTVGAATLAIAWLFSQFSPAWTTRYLGVALGPIFLLASLGLARAGVLGLVALVIVLGIWSIPRSSSLENKSNAADLAAAVENTLKPGDLVITLQPEQAPLMDYTLPPGLEEATQLGEVEIQGVMDWRDVQERLEAATPEKNLAPLLDRLPRSRRVLLVHPVTSNNGDWDAPWTQLVRRRSAQWGQALEADPRFTREAAVPSFYRRAGRIGVRGVLYQKTRD